MLSKKRVLGVKPELPQTADADADSFDSRTFFGLIVNYLSGFVDIQHTCAGRLARGNKVLLSWRKKLVIFSQFWKIAGMDTHEIVAEASCNAVTNHCRF
jgi:hypothetical protein